MIMLFNIQDVFSREVSFNVNGNNIWINVSFGLPLEGCAEKENKLDWFEHNDIW